MRASSVSVILGVDVLDGGDSGSSAWWWSSCSGWVYRAQISHPAQWALQNPKWTVRELRQHALTEGLCGPAQVPSETTVWRALRKAGLQRKRASFRDAGNAAIAAERGAFQRAQRQDPSLAAEQLLFFDESLFQLNAQLGHGWAVDGPARLPQRKGLTQPTMLLLTLGQLGDENRMILHASFRPPQRAAAALPATYQASELKASGRGVPELRAWTRRGLRQATVKTLKAILKEHGVQSSGLRKAALVNLALQLKATGRLGT